MRLLVKGQQEESQRWLGPSRMSLEQEKTLGCMEDLMRVQRTKWSCSVVEKPAMNVPEVPAVELSTA